MAISHALVLPDRDFETWLATTRPYLNAFERVAVVRSPAGNDLNRFRNVSAVQAPGVWINDDALAHIRRAYPFVVLVDVIRATTPTQLQSILQTRINNQDRYGSRQTDPKHLYDRFVLDWMTTHRPTRITRPFSTNSDPGSDVHEGFDIETVRGAKVQVAAEGIVSRVLTTNDELNYGAYVQITSQVEGVRYIVTYAGLQNIQVQINQFVQVGDELAEAGGEAVKIVVQQPGAGTDEFRLPAVVNPILMVYWQGLRLRPTVNSLRVRSLPNDTTGEILGNVGPTTLLETAEVHGRTLAKVGREGQWLQIRRAGVNRAYVAAWLLRAMGEDDVIEAIPGVAVPGVNIDLDHPQGRPDANVLTELGWVRLRFNVSLNPSFPEGDDRRYGNTDVNATFNRYQPLLRSYAQAGIKAILVLTHQTYGEGQGFVWPQMNTERWRELTRGYVNIVRQVAERFAGTGLVSAYQIWNEQDTEPQNARAAVPMPSGDYGFLLAQAIQAIRTADRSTPIITGGHVGGPEAAVAYAKQSFAAMSGGVRPDGVAFHPYGRGMPDNRFSPFGTIAQAMNVYVQAMPGQPVWLTEWGILDQQGNDSIAGEASQYARDFIRVLTSNYPGQVACAIWYAWADGMDNGYGLVRSNGTPRQPLYGTYLQGL